MTSFTRYVVPFAATLSLLFVATAHATDFVRADCNLDGLVDVSDAVSTLELLFRGEGLPLSERCAKACDANDDGVLDVSDAVRTLLVLFAGTASIAPPSECGTDPTDDRLDCVVSSCETTCGSFLLRSATAYPDVSVTDETAAMSSLVEAPLSLVWSVTGFFVQVEERVRVVGIAGVGEDDGTPQELLSDLSLVLHAYSSREAFEQDPLRGDVINGRGARLARPPEVFGGSPDAGWQRHYFEFELEPVELAPGEYVLSVQAYRVGPIFAWAESRHDLGSSFIANDTHPGRSFDLTLAPGFQTGTAAVDIIVERVCE